MLTILSFLLEYILAPLLMLYPIYLCITYSQSKKAPSLYAALLLGMIFAFGIHKLNIWSDILYSINLEHTLIILCSIVLVGFLVKPISKLLMNKVLFIDSLLILLSSFVGFGLFSSYAIFDYNIYDVYFVNTIIAFSVGALLFVMLMARSPSKTT